jgi:hypothetical protein
MHDPSPIFIILFLFGIIAIMRGRVGGRGFLSAQRRLEQEIADLRAKQRELGPNRGASADQVQMLEDRVRVLERIVTDQNYSLANEIEALRDKPSRKEEIGQGGTL